MKYKDIYITLAEDVVKIPPAAQCWHDFNRAFFQDSSADFKEFIEEYVPYYSSIEAFLRDSDNSSLEKTLDDMGIKFIEAINLCTGLEYSEIVKKLAQVM